MAMSGQRCGPWEVLEHTTAPEKMLTDYSSFNWAVSAYGSGRTHARQRRAPRRNGQ